MKKKFIIFSFLLFTSLNAEHPHTYVSQSWHQTDNKSFKNHAHDFFRDNTWNNTKIGSSYNHKYDQLNTVKTAQQNNDTISFISKDDFHKEINQHALLTFKDQIAEYNTLNTTYLAHTPSVSHAISKRLATYKGMSVADASRYTTQTYILNDNVKQLLSTHGYHTSQFNTCFGNPLEQVIHQEAIDILDRVDRLLPDSLLYDHQSALIDFTVAMASYNHEGLTDKATQIGDLCWTLLDFGQAVIEGAALGVYSAASDILSNPIEATVCIIAGKEILAYQLCKVLYNVADISVTAITDWNHAKEKWNNYTEPISNIINAINKKEISLRDAVKGSTTLIVGLYAQNRLLSGLGKFCNTIKQKSINAIQKSPLLKPQEYLATPEGLLLKATSEIKPAGKTSSAANVKNSIQKIPTTNNLAIPEFIQQNRIPLDRETILHSINFKKTKIAPVKGAQIYTKDNLFYHRDTFHRGKGAHLEVYNKQGIHLGEADPITGQLIKNTADKNKKLILK